MVNGNRLDETKSENEEEYMVPLNHLDRIFVGVNTLFLFKYPLYKNYKANVEQQLKEQNPELDV